MVVIGLLVQKCVTEFSLRTELSLNSISISCQIKSYSQLQELIDEQDTLDLVIMNYQGRRFDHNFLAEYFRIVKPTTSLIIYTTQSENISASNIYALIHHLDELEECLNLWGIYYLQHQQKQQVSYNDISLIKMENQQVYIYHHQTAECAVGYRSLKRYYQENPYPYFYFVNEYTIVNLQKVRAIKNGQIHFIESDHPVEIARGKVRVIKDLLQSSHLLNN